MTEVNRALTELHNEGTVAQLAKTYLDVDQLLPTPTPAPTSTPGPGADCVDGLALIQHLGFDDQNMSTPPDMEPGQAFSKGWQVKNTGTCTWDNGYQLVYAGGNHPAAGMSGQPVAIQGQVAPGATYDLYVNLIAPLRPGTYQGFWQVENKTGQAFGERLPVGILVMPGATVTPAPTQTPSPGISYSVDRDHIQAGECVVLVWSVENVKAVYFYEEDERWQDSGVSGEGRRQECPPHSTTYYLRVVKPDNSVEVRHINVYVEPAPDAPQINRFTVDPPNQIAMGQCVSIRWQVEGDVTEVDVLSNDVALWEDAPLRGNLQDCPAGPAIVTYVVQAAGSGGNSQARETVNVVEAATATPVPTDSPDLPQIYSFSVSPNQIAAGECVGVSWSVGGGASMIEMRRNDTLLLSDTTFVGQEMDCLDEAGGYVYRLDAYNLGGQSAHQEETVSVSESAAENPLVGTSWSATAYHDGAAMASTLEGTALTAAFGIEGELHGSAGCNTYSASYLVNESALAINAPLATNLSCQEPEGIMQQEQAFLAALGLAAAFDLEGNQLYFQDDSGQAVLEFVRLDR
jgi:heat shock protein HslJ